MNKKEQKHIPETEQKKLLEPVFKQSGLQYYDMMKDFSVYAPRTSLARFLTHYELFKKVVDIPGVVVDLGVFKGNSTFTFAKLIEIFCPTDIKKKVYGFDTFEGFPSIHKKDGELDESEERVIGGYHSGLEDMLKVLGIAKEAMNADRHLNHIERIEFIKGDAKKSIPKFCKDYGTGLKISILNLDFDLYEPTKVALEHFEPLMSKGGIIILDEYADINWPGETQAVDEYFLNKYGIKPTIRKFPWHSNPSAYIVIE